MAVKGMGTTLSHGTDGTAYTALASVVSVDGPSAEVKTVEATDLSSVAVEVVTTILDAGEVSFVLNYDSTEATHVSVTDMLSTADDDHYWKIVLSDTTSIVFQGPLTGWELTGMELEGLVQADCSIKISGAITITAAS